MAIKVAIIGLGIMGRRMLEHMDRHAAFQPIAVWDPDPAACAAGNTDGSRHKTCQQRR
jgi:3-hydroxyisobutyrate dehydrogenase-like beta-hydroxyacid dehydrogenase